MTEIRKHDPSITDYRTLHKVQRVIDLLLALNHKMPLTHARAFIEVAMNPGKGPTAYSKALGVAQPTMSRTLLDLGPNPRYRENVTKLVDRSPSAMSLRDQEYFLTVQGYKLMRDIIDIVK